MILHLNDWRTEKDAIVDVKTKNTSFLHYVKTLKTMNIENHAWPLALLNPNLQGIDPFNPKLTTQECAMVSIESKFNYFYFLREVAKVPMGGSNTPSPFLANRSNMAVYWCFLNNIDAASIAPRQTGKSITADELNNWLLNVSGNKLKIQLLTRGNDLRVKNVKSLKRMREQLPAYMNYYQKGVDVDNLERLTCDKFGNEYVTMVAQSDKGRADSLGRGDTVQVSQIDEAPYCTNIHISLGVMLSAAGRAREISEANGTFYGNLITTTAGKKDTVEGEYIYNLIHNAMYWNEGLLDSGSRENAWKIVRERGRGEHKRTMVNCTFSHRQLGYDDEWLRKRIADSLNDDEESIERDYLNVWTSGSTSSPLSAKLNGVIRSSQKEVTYVQRSPHDMMLEWLIPTNTISNRLRGTDLILSVDPSEGGGDDGIGITVSDAQNEEVLAVSNCNLANLLYVGQWLGDLLIMFKNMTMIMERKSQGPTLLDIIATYLISKGENPFFRIFNWVVQDASKDRKDVTILKTANVDLESLYQQYKKKFGFSTTGESRSLLYGSIFKELSKSCGHLVNSQALIDQILALVKKNNRIDHPPGGHDDLVIAWLMSDWLLTYGKNLDLYGMRLGNIKSLVASGGAILTEAEIKARQIKEEIIKKINRLKEQLLATDDILSMTTLEARIKVLSNQLVESDDAAKVMAELAEHIKAKKEAKKKSLSEALRLYT